MHIAIVTSEFGEDAGGLSYSCFSFSKMLKALGHVITVIPSVDIDLKDSINDSIFSIIHDECIISEGGYRKDLKNHLFFRGHLKNVIRRTKDDTFDLIVSFGAGMNGAFAAELAQMLNIRLFVLLRGSEINLSASDPTLREYNFQCLKRADKVIALSIELIERSKEIYFNASIEYVIIPIAIRTTNKISTPDQNKRMFVLGCGSKNLNEKKGISNLIAMTHYLHKNTDKEFKFEFAGKVDSDLQESYNNLSKRLNVQHSITFLGELDRGQFIERMKIWDFYIQGSFCEGFSNSVADYLSLGKAFMISDSGFVAESIREVTNETVFEDYIPQNMAIQLIRLIDNPDLSTIFNKAYIAIGEYTNSIAVESKWKVVLEKQKNLRYNNLHGNKNILSVVLHDIGDEINSNINTTPESFNSFINQISGTGYRLCSVKEYFSSMERSNLIICTFDDAYYGIKEFALPRLKEHGFSATVFVCSNYIGTQNDWNCKDTKIRKHLDVVDLHLLKQENWEIGSHGLTHRSLLKLSEDDLLKELEMSKNNLEELFGEINTYAYPYGDFNDFCKSHAQEVYKTAFALSKGGTLEGIDNHQIRRYFISEILKVIVK